MIQKLRKSSIKTGKSITIDGKRNDLKDLMVGSMSKNFEMVNRILHQVHSMEENTAPDTTNWLPMLLEQPIVSRKY